MKREGGEGGGGYILLPSALIKQNSYEMLNSCLDHKMAKSGLKFNTVNLNEVLLDGGVQVIIC